MAIKIIKKSASSNETQTLPENAFEKVAKAPPTGHPEPGTITPFIDKISVVLTVPQGADAYDIHSGIWAQLDDKEAFRSAKKWGPFQVGVRLPLPSVVKQTKWPFLHYRHGEHQARQFRVEFSPVDLGPQGLGELHAQLTSLVHSARSGARSSRPGAPPRHARSQARPLSPAIETQTGPSEQTVPVNPFAPGTLCAHIDRRNVRNGASAGGRECCHTR